MAGDESIVLAFPRIYKPTKSFKLTQRVKPVAPACEHLMDVGLMSYIPENLVLRTIESMMQCQGDFDDAQIGRQVPAGLRDAFNYLLANLAGHRLQLRRSHTLYFGRRQVRLDEGRS